MRNSLLLNIKFLVRDLININHRMLPNLKKIKECNRIGKQIVYLLDIPTYSNLGDQAIGYAERKFFDNSFPQAEVIEVEGYMVKYYLGFIRRHVKKEDLLVHIGGGNFGDLYPAIEDNRIKLLSEIKNHRVILFPQTIYYTDTERGQQGLKKMQAAIANHGDVIIIAREKISFEFARETFRANVILNPDIVLYLKKYSNFKRDGVLLCLRDDEEKKADYFETITSTISKHGEKYIITDTISNQAVHIENREKILDQKWHEFQGSKVVITDRLHGMIFSFITGTPCIVLENKNFKIKSFYDTWLSNVGFIRLLRDISELDYYLEYVYKYDSEECRLNCFDSYFERLAAIIGSK